MSSVKLSSLATGTQWDQYGNALSGRTIYVYKPGTSTQVQVFSDAALTAPVTQPLTLGSDGTPGAAPGYVLAGQSFEFFDVTSSTRAQAEPVSATSTVSAGQAAPGTASAIGTGDVYVVRSDGTVRRVQAPEALVDAWGADPSGVADSSAAIASAFATGNTVVFGSGTYKDTGAGHSLDPHSQEVRGAGKNNTTINYTGSGTWLITSTRGFACRAMTIQGSSAGAGGLSLNNLNDWTLEDLDALGFSNGTAIKLTNAVAGQWRNTNARNSKIGLDCDQATNLNQFLGGNITGNGNAAGTGFGARFGTTTGPGEACVSNFLCGIQFAGNSNLSLFLQFAHNNTVDTCWFELNTGPTGGTCPADIELGAGSGALLANQNTLRRNYFTDTAVTNHIQVVNGSYNHIDTNYHSGNFTTAIRLEAGADRTRISYPNTGSLLIVEAGSTRTIREGFASGNGGAAAGFITSAASLTTGSVVPINSTEFDIEGMIDPVTNKGRITPSVPGIYEISALIQSNVVLTTDQYFQAALYKNGSNFKWGGPFFQAGSGSSVGTQDTWLVQANGTDYFEVRLTHNTGGSAALAVGQANTRVACKRIAIT